MKLRAAIAALLFLCAGCAVLSESDQSPHHKQTTQRQSRASAQTKPVAPVGKHSQVLRDHPDSSCPSLSNRTEAERTSQSARTPEGQRVSANHHSGAAVEQIQNSEESRLPARSEVQSPEDLLEVVWIHFRRFRFKEAIDAVSAVIAHSTASPIQRCDAYVLGGASAFQLQDLPLARQFFGLALQQCPNVVINRELISSETCRVFDQTKASKREER